jgi:hypothetical protein
MSGALTRQDENGRYALTGSNVGSRIDFLQTEGWSKVAVSLVPRV